MIGCLGFVSKLSGKGRGKEKQDGPQADNYEAGDKARGSLGEFLLLLRSCLKFSMIKKLKQIV